MYNAAFKSLGLNFVYVSFDVKDLAAAIEGLRALNIRGVSVSRPFKESAICFIDDIHPTAKVIGAINIINNENGKFVGYNSDWIGAIRTLGKYTDLSGKRVAIVGAGGAARAIAYGLKVKGASVYLYNRAVAKLPVLSKELGIIVGGGLNDLDDLRKADVIVNATPVGCVSISEKEIVPTEVLRAGQIVLDAVFFPLDTKLILDALKVKCTVIRGIEMLVNQGAFTFELFTGRAAPVETMLESLMVELET
jgi:shikimate dehydrogenase